MAVVVYFLGSRITEAYQNGACGQLWAKIFDVGP